MLFFAGLNLQAQDISEKEKEVIQGKINYKISLAQKNIDNNEL